MDLFCGRGADMKNVKLSYKLPFPYIIKLLLTPSLGPRHNKTFHMKGSVAVCVILTYNIFRSITAFEARRGEIMGNLLVDWGGGGGGGALFYTNRELYI